MSWLLASGGQNIGVSALSPILPMNIRPWFPLRLTDLIFLQSKWLVRVFQVSSASQFEFTINSSALNLLLGFPYSSVGKDCLQCRRPGFDPWVGKIPWRRERLPSPVFLGFPFGSAGKESVCNVGGLACCDSWGHKESDTTERLIWSETGFKSSVTE